MNPATAQHLALDLMIDHGLVDLGWRFKFNNRKRAFGLCNYTYKSIELSLPLVTINDEDKVRTTILHEIAHAIAGHQAGHSYRWAAEARKLGIKPVRCFSEIDTNVPQGKYTLTCSNCGYKHPMHRRPTRIYKHNCSPLSKMSLTQNY